MDAEARLDARVGLYLDVVNRLVKAARAGEHKLMKRYSDLACELEWAFPDIKQRVNELYPLTPDSQKPPGE